MLKKSSDHVIKNSPMCGQIIEILTRDDRGGLDIAVAVDIKPTVAHYHTNFEEI